MKTNITFRHMESSDALKQHANEKIKKLEKYKDEACEAHVTLSVEGHRHLAEINYSAKHFNAVGKSETSDMYASIDEAIGKVEKAVRRHHDKQSNRK